MSREQCPIFSLTYVKKTNLEVNKVGAFKLWVLRLVDCLDISCNVDGDHYYLSAAFPGLENQAWSDR